MKALVVALFAMLSPGGLASAEQRSEGIVAPLTDQAAIDGCSWSASSTQVGKGFMFLAEYDQSRVLMNLDGVDTELKLMKQEGDLREVGSVYAAVYQTNGTVVDATYRATWVCPQDGTSESCEVTRFDASYEVSNGARRQIVKATGDVGC